MEHILYTRLKIKLRFHEEVILPTNKTSTLRGGIGQMLLINNCIRDRRCDKCALKYSCIVKNLYNREIREWDIGIQASPSFILNCSNYNTKFNCNDVLIFEAIVFQDSIAYLPQFFDAIEELGFIGLGTRMNKFTIDGIFNENGELVFKNGKRNSSKISIKTLQDYIDEKRDEEDGSIKGIEFITPLRVKSNGSLTDSISEDVIKKSLHRRIATLNAFIGEKTLIKSEDLIFKITKSELIWREDFERYSSTQNVNMKLGGVTGTIYLENINNIAEDLLIAGELLHLGKNTVFGLGRYRIIT